MLHQTLRRPAARMPLAACLALSTACSAERVATAAPPIASTLAVSPGRLQLSDSTPSARVFVTVTPSGGRLDWQLTSKPAWLTVTPERGMVSGTPVDIAVDATALAQANPGTYTGAIEFVSNGGAASIEVIGVSLPLFRFAVTQPSLDLAESVDTARVWVRNVGKSPLQNIEVSAAASWLRVLAGRPVLNRGDSVAIPILVDRDPLPAGPTASTLIVRTASTRDSVRVPITVRTAAAPRLVVRTNRLTFTPADSVSILMLANTGKGALTWSLNTTPPWLLSSPSSGSIAAGDSIAVTLRVDWRALPATDVSADVRVVSNATPTSVTVPVQVSAAPGFAPGLTLLDHQPIDAESHRASGLIVTVSAAPSRLTMLDAVAGSVRTIALPRIPTTVSISPDGTQAAVGHDGAMTLVDLVGQRVVRQYAVPVDVLDIVLAGPAWAYAFPRRDQWTSIQSVNLATGAVTTTMNHPGIYAGTLGRLHPSGQSIYGSQNGIGPSDHERYDIQGGPAQRLYDSRYHGQFEMGGDAWFSHDGGFLFNSWGNAFSISPSQSQDMLYAGRLGPLRRVQWVEDAPQVNRILAVGGGADSLAGQVATLDRTTFEYRGRLSLPPFTVGAASVPAVATHAFVARDRVSVLVRSDPGAPTAPRWGVVRVPREQLP